MATINDIIIQASELQPGISRLLRNSTYPRYDDLSGLEINYEDGEQLFLLDELRGIMEKLADVEDCIRYIGQPVLKTERLRKNASGRYETGSGPDFPPADQPHALQRLLQCGVCPASAASLQQHRPDRLGAHEQQWLRLQRRHLLQGA